MTAEIPLHSLEAFQIRECAQGDCRFRYPVSISSEGSLVCPLCGNPAPTVGEPFVGRSPAPDMQSEPALGIEVMLDNLRSSYNVGSILRTCDGAGIRHVHLCGITSTPSQAKVRKTALGAQNTVPWSYHRNALDAVQELRQLGYRIWSLENRGLSQSLFEVTPKMMAVPLILVVGNELSGVDPDILKRSDQVISVPMVGLKASLNAVVAFGVAAYWLQFGLRSSREKL